MPTIPPASGRARGPRAVRQALATTVTAALACLLAACAAASVPAPAPAGGAAASHETHSAGTRPAAPASTPATVPGMNGLAICQPAALKVTVDTTQASGAAGSTYYPVNFTNTAKTACGMYGYPGVSFVTAGNRTGSQIGAAAQRNPAVGDLAVRLAPGGMAHAWLQVAQAANYPASSCQPQTAQWLRVYPPGDTVASYVSRSFTACASASAPLLTVMPVRPGQGVQGATP